MDILHTVSCCSVLFCSDNVAVVFMQSFQNNNNMSLFSFSPINTKIAQKKLNNSLKILFFTEAALTRQCQWSQNARYQHNSELEVFLYTRRREYESKCQILVCGENSVKKKKFRSCLLKRNNHNLRLISRDFVEKNHAEYVWNPWFVLHSLLSWSKQQILQSVWTSYFDISSPLYPLSR